MMRFKLPQFKKKKPSLNEQGDSLVKKKNKKQVVSFVTQLGPRELWWSLDEQVQLSENQPNSTPPQEGHIISFCVNDKDLVLSSVSKTSAEIKDFISDFGEDSYSFQMRHGKQNKKNLGAWKGINSACFYATPQSRFDGLNERVGVISGVAVLRSLLAKNEPIQSMEAPFVTGVLFPSADGGTQAIVLYLCDEEGRLTNFDYVPITGDDPSSAIRLFVQSNRLSSSGEWSNDRLAIFSSTEIQDVVDAIKVYPRQIEFYGFGVDHLFKMGAWSSGSLLVLAALYTGWLTYDNNQTKKILKSNDAALKAAVDSVNSYIGGPLFSAIISRKTVNIADVLERANKVWAPGAVVLVEATPKMLTLSVEYTLKTSEFDASSIVTFLRRASPEGCERSPVKANPQINKLLVKYECKTSDPYLLVLDRLSR